jgi:hypothetical protein
MAAPHPPITWEVLVDEARAAADARGVTPSEWITERRAHREALLGLRQLTDEWQAEHGAFTADEIDRAEAELDAAGVGDRRKDPAAIHEDELVDEITRAAASAGMSEPEWLDKQIEDRIAILSGLRHVAEWEAEHGTITEEELAAADARLDAAGIIDRRAAPAGGDRR